MDDEAEDGRRPPLEQAADPDEPIEVEEPAGEEEAMVGQNDDADSAVEATETGMAVDEVNTESADMPSIDAALVAERPPPLVEPMLVDAAADDGATTAAVLPLEVAIKQEVITSYEESQFRATPLLPGVDPREVSEVTLYERDEEETNTAQPVAPPERVSSPAALAQRRPAAAALPPAPAAGRSRRQRKDQAASAAAESEAGEAGPADRPVASRERKRHLRTGQSEWDAFDAMEQVKTKKLTADPYPAPIPSRRFPDAYTAKMVVTARTDFYFEVQVPGSNNQYDWETAVCLKAQLPIHRSQFFTGITRRIQVDELEQIIVTASGDPKTWRNEYAVCDKVYVTFEFGGSCDSDLDYTERCYSWNFHSIEHTGDPDDKIPRVADLIVAFIHFAKTRETHYGAAMAPRYGAVTGDPNPGPFSVFRTQVDEEPTTGRFARAIIAMAPKGDVWKMRCGDNVRMQHSVMSALLMPFDEVKQLTWHHDDLTLLSLPPARVKKLYEDRLAIIKVVQNMHTLRESSDAAHRRISVWVTGWYLSFFPARLSVIVPDVEPDEFNSLAKEMQTRLRTAQSLALEEKAIVTVCIPTERQLKRARLVAEGKQELAEKMPQNEPFAALVSATVIDVTPNFETAETTVCLEFSTSETTMIAPLVVNKPQWVVLEAPFDSALGDRQLRRLTSMDVRSVFDPPRGARADAPVAALAADRDTTEEPAAGPEVLQAATAAAVAEADEAAELLAGSFAQMGADDGAAWADAEANFKWRLSLNQGLSHLYRAIGSVEAGRPLVPDPVTTYQKALPLIDAVEPFAPLLARTKVMGDSGHPYDSTKELPLLQEQLEFAKAVLLYRNTLVATRGPPGTGKTATLVGTILEGVIGKYGVHPFADSHSIYSAPTNAACDEFATQLWQQCQLHEIDPRKPDSPFRAVRVLAVGVGERQETGSIKVPPHILDLNSLLDTLDYTKLTPAMCKACGLLTDEEQKIFDDMTWTQRNTHTGDGANPFGSRTHSFARARDLRAAIPAELQTLCDLGLLSKQKFSLAELDIGTGAPNKARFVTRLTRARQLSQLLTSFRVSTLAAGLVLINPHFIITTSSAATQRALATYQPKHAFCDEAAFMPLASMYDVLSMMSHDAQQLVLLGDERQLYAMSRTDGDVLKIWARQAVFRSLYLAGNVWKEGQLSDLKAKRENLSVASAQLAIDADAATAPVATAELVPYVQHNSLTVSWRGRTGLVNMVKQLFYPDVPLSAHQSNDQRMTADFISKPIFWPCKEADRDAMYPKDFILIDNLTAGEDEPAQGTSRCNHHEVQTFLYYFFAMYLCDTDGRMSNQRPTQLAVLTYYKGQERALDQAFAALQVANPPLTLTVDKYQGQQAEMVSLLTTRAVHGERRKKLEARAQKERPNDPLAAVKDRMGFALQPERLNVAISRPRTALLILLDAETLDDAAHFGELIEWAKKNDYYRTNHVTTWIERMRTSPDQETRAQYVRITALAKSVTQRVIETQRADAASVMLALDMGNALPLRSKPSLQGRVGAFAEAICDHEFHYAPALDEGIEESRVVIDRLRDGGEDICQDENTPPPSDSGDSDDGTGLTETQHQSARMAAFSTGGAKGALEYDLQRRTILETKQLPPEELEQALLLDDELTRYRTMTSQTQAARTEPTVVSVSHTTASIKLSNGITLRAGVDSGNASQWPAAYRALSRLEAELNIPTVFRDPFLVTYANVPRAAIDPHRQQMSRAQRSAFDVNTALATLQKRRAQLTAAGEHAQERFNASLVDDARRRANHRCQRCNLDGHYIFECLLTPGTPLYIGDKYNLCCSTGPVWAARVCSSCRLGGHAQGHVLCPLLSKNALERHLVNPQCGAYYRRIRGQVEQVWTNLEEHHGKRWRAPPVFGSDSQPAGPLYVMPCEPSASSSAAAASSSTASADVPSTSTAGGDASTATATQPSDSTASVEMEVSDAAPPSDSTAEPPEPQPAVEQPLQQLQPAVEPQPQPSSSAVEQPQPAAEPTTSRHDAGADAPSTSLALETPTTRRTRRPCRFRPLSRPSRPTAARARADVAAAAAEQCRKAFHFSFVFCLCAFRCRLQSPARLQRVLVSSGQAVTLVYQGRQAVEL